MQIDRHPPRRAASTSGCCTACWMAAAVVVSTRCLASSFTPARQGAARSSSRFGGSRYACHAATTDDGMATQQRPQSSLHRAAPQHAPLHDPVGLPEAPRATIGLKGPPAGAQCLNKCPCPLAARPATRARCCGLLTSAALVCSSRPSSPRARALHVHAGAFPCTIRSETSTATNSCHPLEKETHMPRRQIRMTCHHL